MPDNNTNRGRPQTLIISILQVFSVCCFFVGGLFLLIHFKSDLSDLVVSQVTSLFKRDSTDTYWSYAIMFFVGSAILWIVRDSVIRIQSITLNSQDWSRSSTIRLYIEAPLQSLLSITRHLIKRYDESSIAAILRALQPLGVVLAAAALLFTAYGLELSKRERESRIMERGATFRMMVNEKLAVVRERFIERARSTQSNSDGEEIDPADALMYDYELVDTLKLMVNLKAPLDGLGAHLVRIDGLTLKKVSLNNSLFIGSVLTDADFSGSDLTNAIFFGAELRSPNFVGSTLKDSNFVAATVTSGDFRNAKLCGTKFDNGHLMDADFRRAELTDVTFEGTNISDVDFTGSKGLTPPQITNACINRDTRRPKGLPDEWKPQVMEHCPIEWSLF